MIMNSAGLNLAREGYPALISLVLLLFGLTSTALQADDTSAGDEPAQAASEQPAEDERETDRPAGQVHSAAITRTRVLLAVLVMSVSTLAPLAT